MRNCAFFSPLDDRRKFSEGFRMEFQHEPAARLSQHGFPAEIKKLKIELRTLERSRHRNHFIRGSAFPDFGLEESSLNQGSAHLRQTFIYGPVTC